MSETVCGADVGGKARLHGEPPVSRASAATDTY